MTLPMDRPEQSAADLSWRPESAQDFEFVDRSLDLASGRVELIYRLGDFELVERLELPGAPFNAVAARLDAVEAALDLVHWTAGVSYWKAACPKQVRFGAHQPDAWQSAWLERLYRQGLAEFAFENDLDTDQFPAFPFGESSPARPCQSKLQRRTLVPMGGGKDSLVAWERLRRLGESPDSIQVGSAPLIQALGAELPGQHWVVRRTLDPRLGELNRAGALNGHVPVTAINSAILLLMALLMDYDRVVFANERSASEASRLDQRGRAVNHQFSKSFEFEAMFGDWVSRYVHASLEVFSLLRRDREVAICREFAAHEQWHQQFSSHAIAISTSMARADSAGVATAQSATSYFFVWLRS